MERYQRANKFIMQFAKDQNNNIFCLCRASCRPDRGARRSRQKKTLLGYLHSSNLRWHCENITTKATMTAFYPAQLPLPCDSVELTNRAPPTEQKRLAQSLHLFIRNSEVPRYRTIRILDFWPLIRSLYSCLLYTSPSPRD